MALIRSQRGAAAAATFAVALVLCLGGARAQLVGGGVAGQQQDPLSVLSSAVGGITGSVQASSTNTSAGNTLGGGINSTAPQPASVGFTLQNGLTSLTSFFGGAQAGVQDPAAAENASSAGDLLAPGGFLHSVHAALSSVPTLPSFMGGGAVGQQQGQAFAADFGNASAAPQAAATASGMPLYGQPQVPPQTMAQPQAAGYPAPVPGANASALGQAVPAGGAVPSAANASSGVGGFLSSVHAALSTVPQFPSFFGGAQAGQQQVQPPSYLPSGPAPQAPGAVAPVAGANSSVLPQVVATGSGLPQVPQTLVQPQAGGAPTLVPVPTLLPGANASAPAQAPTTASALPQMPNVSALPLPNASTSLLPNASALPQPTAQSLAGPTGPPTIPDPEPAWQPPKEVKKKQKYGSKKCVKTIKKRLEPLIVAAQDKRREIEEYWDLPAEAFEQTMSPDMSMKYVEDSMLESLATCGSFVFGVLGSSVTAGHDNFFNQSYPQVFERTMKEVLAEANVTVEVRNQAMGGASHVLAMMCVEAMVGDDADVVWWEYDMMMAGSESRVGYPVEHALRNAIAMPKRPSFVVIHADSPRKAPKGQELKPEKGPIPSWRFGSKKDPAIASYYHTKGFHASALYSCRAIWGRDTESPFTHDDFQFKDKPWGRAAGWHPGPVGHKHRGDTLAWNYLRMFENAAKRLVEDGVGAVKEVKKPTEIPPPFLCNKGGCEKSPYCLTTYEAQVDQMGGLKTRGVRKPHYGWTVQISSADRGAVAAGKMRGAGYRDVKYVWETVLNNETRGRWLSIDLHEVSETGGMIVVCEPSTGWKYPKGGAPLPKWGEFRLTPYGEDPDSPRGREAVMFPLKPRDFKAAVSPSPVKLPLCNQVVYPKMMVGKDPLVDEVPGGKYSLHIRVKPDLNISTLIGNQGGQKGGRRGRSQDPEIFAALTHVVVW